jgi:glutaredoxin
MKVILYKTPDCPRCRLVTAHLERLRIDFETRDMSDPAILTDLRCEGVFTLAAPVLQVEGHYFTEDQLFQDGGMQTAFIEEAVKH